VTGFLGLFMALFMAAYALARGEVRTLWPNHLGRQTLRSCLDLGTNVSVVVALRHLSLTLFYILIFLAPIATSAMGAVFLREALTWRKVAAIVAGFAGVVIAVNPFGSTRQGDWVGFAACMACVAFFSVNMVWSRVLTQTERPESLTFYSGVMMAAGCFGLMLWHAAPLTARLTGGLVAMGVFCALGSLFFFVALKHTTAATVSQYHYTQLVTGALLGYLIWHTKPTVFMVVGGVLIAAAGLYIAVASPPSQHPAVGVSTIASD
jgi:drug/metabolite transporter (DMT)-like permease